MHLAEGLLPLELAVGAAVLAVPFLLDGARAQREHQLQASRERRALAGLSGALLFAFTLVPIPVPIIGVSSHLCVTPLLGLWLGPRLVVIPATIVLLLQALFFAHGGLTTLFANVLTLGVVGPWSAWALFRVARRLGVAELWAVGLAATLGDLLVYASDTLLLAGALTGERSYLSWVATIGLGLLPGQGPLAIIEGLASAALYRGLAARRPQLRAVALSAGILVFAAPATAAAFPGLDEEVFVRLSTEAGRPASDPVFDWEEGELGRFLLATAAFTAGVIAGRRSLQLGAPKP